MIGFSKERPNRSSIDKKWIIGLSLIILVFLEGCSPLFGAEAIGNRRLFAVPSVAANMSEEFHKESLVGGGHPCKFCPPEIPWPNETAIMDSTIAAIQQIVGENVDPQTTIEVEFAQTFQHWGSSMAWWANGVGEWTDEPQLSSLLNLIYSNFTDSDLIQGLSNGSGIPATLGLTQARFNIGGSPKKPLADPGSFYRPGAAVETFLREDGTWDWSAEPAQRKVLALALERGVSYVQAFANSPPWWMTISKNTTGQHAWQVDNHTLPAAGDNMVDENITKFTKYLADVCYAFATNKNMLFGRTYTFESISPLNEPGSFWWDYGNDQEGCHFDYKQQALVVDAMRKELDVKPETRSIAVAAAEGNKIFQTSRAMHTFIHSNTSTMEKLGLTTTHQYSFLTGKTWIGGIGPELRFLHKQAASNGKDVWVSELGTGAGPIQGGLRLAKRIIAALLDLKPTTWTLWQVVSLHNDLVQTGWAQIVATYPPAPAAFQIRPQYYAYKQFTAFIRPGSRIIGGCRLCALKRSDLVVALLPDNQTAVVVAVNLAENTSAFTLHFTSPGFVFEVESTLATYLTDATHNCSLVESPTLYQGSLQLALAPKSVTSFVLRVKMVSFTDFVAESIYAPNTWSDIFFTLGGRIGFLDTLGVNLAPIVLLVIGVGIAVNLVILLYRYDVHCAGTKPPFANALIVMMATALILAWVGAGIAVIIWDSAAYDVDRGLKKFDEAINMLNTELITLNGTVTNANTQMVGLQGTCRGPVEHWQTQVESLQEEVVPFLGQSATNLNTASSILTSTSSTLEDAQPKLGRWSWYVSTALVLPAIVITACLTLNYCYKGGGEDRLIRFVAVPIALLIVATTICAAIGLDMGIAIGTYCHAPDSYTMDLVAKKSGGVDSVAYQIYRFYITGLGANPLRKPAMTALAGLEMIDTIIVKTLLDALSQLCSAIGAADFPGMADQVQTILAKFTYLFNFYHVNSFYSDAIYGSLCGDVLEGVGWILVTQLLLALVSLPLVAFLMFQFFHKPVDSMDDRQDKWVELEEERGQSNDEGSE